MKIRSSPSARRPSEEESQRPAGQQADRKDHGEEGDYSAAQSLEKSRLWVLDRSSIGGDLGKFVDQSAEPVATSEAKAGW